VTHGDVRPQNILLPSPTSAHDELTLIDLDAAHELQPDALQGSSRVPALAADVRGFGEVLALLASATTNLPTTGNRPFDALVGHCLAEGHYASMADKRLWQDIASAEREQARRARGSTGMLGSLLAKVRR